MKRILIGYDGSAGAEAALQDLSRAGLPAQAEAKVLTVADVWLPPDLQGEPAFPDRVPQTKFEARQHALDEVKAARATSHAGAARVQALFPGWKVTPVAHPDSPAWGILAEARKWNADLIVVGSHGRSMLQRIFLGSVCQKVAAEAACSVRIYRPHQRGEGPPKILVGFDGSEDSNAAIEEVLDREWPAQTSFSLVTVVDPKLRSMPPAREEWQRPTDADMDWVERMVQEQAGRMKAKGLKLETHILDGEAKSLLLKQAEDWKAETIVLGARGLQHGHRLYLGTFASAIATRAPCSVEIVRPPAKA